MSASAAEGTLLVRRGTVLTLDPKATVLPDHDLLVVAGRIRSLGRDLEAPSGARVVDATGCFVLPGLVQGHVHLGQTLFRAQAGGRRLLAWLRERIWPLEAAHDAESAYDAARLGAAECLLGGTTTIQEIGLGPEAGALLDGIADSGLRAVAGKCLMDEGDGLPERLREPTSTCLEEAERLGERFVAAAPERLHAVLNPRFALSCSEALFRGLVAIAARRGWPIHTHALEQRDETAAVRRRWGRDEIELFEHWGVLEHDLRIAHGVWIRPRHWPRLAEAGCGVVHCPGSNLKLGSGIARVAAMRRAGVAMGIGADGAPCNDRLDAWSELRLAAHLQSLRSGPESVHAVELLRLATSEGARVLGLDAEIGSLEPGKRGDLVVVDGAGPGLAAAPGVDPHELLLFSCGRESVRDVAVGGELCVESGRLRGVATDDLVRRGRRSAARVAARAGLAG